MSTGEAQKELLHSWKEVVSSVFHNNANSVLLRPGEVYSLLATYIESYNIGGFLRAYEEWDADTFGHSLRAAAIALDLVLEEGTFTDDEKAGLALGMILHDLGKREMPPELLTKRGITESERATLHLHPLLGLHRLTTDKDLASVAALPFAKEIVAAHHSFKKEGMAYPFDLTKSKNVCSDPYGLDIEHWDAKMLRGLALASTADIFDALSSDRPYRKAFSSAEDIARIMKDHHHLPADLVDRILQRFTKK